MKNITIAMPDDLAQQTRVLAAKADTSMSQYLCQLVSRKISDDNNYEAAMRRYLTRRRSGLALAGNTMPQRDDIHERSALR